MEKPVGTRRLNVLLTQSAGSVLDANLRLGPIALVALTIALMSSYVSAR